MPDDDVSVDQLPLNPAAMQQALTTMPAPAGGPTPPLPQNIPSMPAPSQEDNVNFGTVPTQGGQPTQEAQTGIPKQSNVPALVGFMHQLFGDQAARGYFPATGGGPGDLGAQPARPVSRLDAFENFLGNFLSSFSQGMAQGGQGPAANARGFGAAVQAPYQRELQQYQLGQQQQLQQAQVGQQQAETELKYQQAQRVPVQPYGPTGPTVYMLPQEAAKTYQAQIGAQARVQAAGVNPFVASQFGVLNRQTGQLVGGTGVGATVTVTPQQAQQYDIPQELVGKTLPTQKFVDFMNAKARSEAITQGSAGPYEVSKTNPNQPPRNLGIGSPAANPLAVQKFDIASAKQLRDVEMNQNQVNPAIERMMRIRANADVLTNMIDAGRINLSMGDDGIIRAAIGRGVHLTEREKQFASDFTSMSEDINLLRLPQGGGGFRSEEAFEALQAQRGRLYQNPQVFLGVVDNTIQSMRGIQLANQNALDRYYAANPRMRPGATGGAAGGGSSKVQDLIKKHGGG